MCTQTVVDMKDPSLMTNSTDKVSSLMQMEGCSKVSTFKIRDMDKAL